MGRYSRGRRGGPAKAVGRETGARVRIPLFPPLVNNTNSGNLLGFVFFSRDYFGIISNFDRIKSKSLTHQIFIIY